MERIFACVVFALIAVSPIVLGVLFMFVLPSPLIGMVFLTLGTFYLYYNLGMIDANANTFSDILFD